MNQWNDFNNADNQDAVEIIPKGTIAKVCMTILPGGYDDASMGLTGGFATRSKNSDAIYLNCEFVILSGQHAKRKVWGMIGLHSPKGDYWGNTGRRFIKAILNSAHGFTNDDHSPAAQRARQIDGFGALDGIEFVARIDIETDKKGLDRNIIQFAITPEHKEYAIYMGSKTHLPSSTLTDTHPPTDNMPPWA